ncbi:MAG: hypothetical protein ACYSWW_19310, partial [Planctomycetota bacterium]
AARISALRGHKVTIFEKTGELGGAMLCCCTVPGKSKMRWHADWLRQQVEKLGIEVKYRTEPKAKDFEGFDVVLLAAGGRIVKPDIPGIDLPIVTTFEDVLRCKSTKCEYYPDDKVEPAPTPLKDSAVPVRKLQLSRRTATLPNGWSRSTETL